MQKDGNNAQTPCIKEPIRQFTPKGKKKKNAHIDRKEEREISLEIVDGGELPAIMKARFAWYLQTTGVLVSGKGLVVCIAVQAIWIIEIRRLWQNEVRGKLSFNKHRSALKTTVRILFKDGSVVAARILAAFHQCGEYRNQLGVKVTTVKCVCRCLFLNVSNITEGIGGGNIPSCPC